MKKLTSFIAVILSALLLCTSVFAANAESPDAYTVYRYAMKKLDEAATIKTTAKYVIVNGLEADVVVTQTQAEGKSLQIEARLIYDGYTIVCAYYKDGYYYQVVEDGLNRKTKMSEGKAIAECYGINRNLKRDAFEDATLEKTDTGYTLKYKVSGKGFGGIHDNALSTIYKDSSIPVSLKSSNVTYVLDIGKDGTLQSYKISFTTRFYEDGYVSVSDLSKRIYCTVTTESKAQKINYPENLDAYKEIELF